MIFQRVYRLDNRGRKVLTTVLMAAIVATAVIATFLVTARLGSAIGPPGATLYENINFNNDPKNPDGRSLTVSEDIACLKDAPFDFDDITSSITVTPGTLVVLYENCGFKGKSEAFTEHDNDLNEGNVILNDKASSVRITEDDQSLGADHKELLARVDALAAEIAARFDEIDAELVVLKDRVGEPEVLGDRAMSY